MQMPDMKQIIFSTLAVAGMFAFISCERHSWEDSEGKKDGTKNLYPKKEHHGDHDSHKDHDKKGDADHGHGDHDGHDHGSHEGHSH